MLQSLTIRDETVGEGTKHEFSLDFLTERITVRELIRSRVFQEVKDYNVRQQQHPSEEFRGLVQPNDAEKTLNGFRLKKPRQIDWQQQFHRAIEAFENNQILILINDRQAGTLEEQIEVGTDTTVSFLRLTMLVGG